MVIFLRCLEFQIKLKKKLKKPEGIFRIVIIEFLLTVGFQCKGGFPLSRNFCVCTDDVNLNWLYVRKLK